MKLAILETVTPPGGLTERCGRDPEMFGRLLGRDLDYRTYDVATGIVRLNALRLRIAAKRERQR